MSLRNPSARFILAKKFAKTSCPECGKKRFRRYIDTATGNMLPESVGICDRINECAYSVTAKQWIDAGGVVENIQRTERPIMPAKRSDWRCPPNKFARIMGNDTPNRFAAWLRASVGADTADKALAMYRVGTYPVGPNYPQHAGAPVFWQIDAQGGVRSGKVIQFKPDGHRDKEINTQWIHSILTGKSMEDIGCAQCLFGEHLLAAMPTATVAVVESEKSAIVCSCFYPDVVWVATGGENNLKVDRLLPLAGRNVVLFPDIGGGYVSWTKEALNIDPMCASLVVSDILECLAHEADAGLDLADFLVPNLIGAMNIDLFHTTVMESPVTVMVPLAENIHSTPIAQEVRMMPPVVRRLIEINPSIANMIEVLDLDTHNARIHA